MPLIAIDHVQLAMPEGGEAAARHFYGALLGLAEIEKPAALAARGGCWFEHGAVQVHLGVEAELLPARKAHPAFLVDDLDRLADRLRAAGFASTPDDALPGYRRCYVSDPFGNRLELMQRRE
jgi:catechol 2,3-dioxygenase-like lactoylglutathione lyase family enzyme